MTLPDLDRDQATELLEALAHQERAVYSSLSSCRMPVPGLPDTSPQVIAWWEARLERVKRMRDEVADLCRAEFPGMLDPF